MDLLRSKWAMTLQCLRRVRPLFSSLFRLLVDDAAKDPVSGGTLDRVDFL